MDKPISIDVTQLETYLYPECESPYCHEVLQIKHVPALMSPTGKEQVIKLPVGFACAECKTSMFTDQMVKESKADPIIELVK